ncbi:putative quinol monooxygenase [Dermabacter vaginalis]|uniref:ABM domain-containing protein n=1 Tax=Dermabacter vaginalis TaxID=1630135 RepID=A0A1B0ZHB4_9MICO|nr:putative quinol monooxygenase [Dermabacter vaginalis]ANP27307.1 hypothetical protein DAD186_07570 [Dermabacter vaginalis]MCG7443221.1 antibiotic biosynthesis monooxygenase [Dermabacter vaginalis]
MIFINVKYQVKPEETATFLEKLTDYTNACRAEEGCLFFEWYRSAERENEFLLVEMYRDSEAGEKHVNYPHFQAGLDTMRPLVAETPEIISKEIEGEGWGPMGELAD